MQIGGVLQYKWAVCSSTCFESSRDSVSETILNHGMTNPLHETPPLLSALKVRPACEDLEQVVKSLLTMKIAGILAVCLVVAVSSCGENKQHSGK